MGTDSLLRAYAILGLQPGCSPRVLKQRYRRLAKQWHPDRYSSDPIALIEATEQMRRINDAYALAISSIQVARIVDRDSKPTADAASNTASTQPFDNHLVDQIRRDIDRSSPVMFLLGRLSWSLPLFAAAWIVLMRPMVFEIPSMKTHEKPISWLEACLAIVLSVFGIVMFVRNRRS